VNANQRTSREFVEAVRQASRYADYRQELGYRQPYPTPYHRPAHAALVAAFLRKLLRLFQPRNHSTEAR